MRSSIRIALFVTAFLSATGGSANTISSYSSMPSDKVTLFPYFAASDFAFYGIAREVWNNATGNWMNCYPTYGYDCAPSGVSHFHPADLSSTVAPFGVTINDPASRYTFSTPVFAVGATLIATNYPNTDNLADSFDDNVENVSYQLVAYGAAGNIIGSTESSSYGNLVGPVEFHTTYRGTEFMASYAGLWLDEPISQLTIMARRPAYDQALLAEVASFSFSFTPLGESFVPEPTTLALLGLGLVGLGFARRKQ